MKSLIIILVGLVSCLWSSDFSSSDTWTSILAPIASGIFLIALLLWLVLNAGFGQKSRNLGGFGGEGGSDGFGGGGDAGGGCD